MRKYKNISNDVINNNLFKEAVNIFNSTVIEEYKEINNYIQVHQIRVNCKDDYINLVPEGIHQDGFNMIALLCINRYNIEGGISNIFTSNNEIDKIYSKKLMKGEMIIINDNKLYHDVTNIKIINNDDIGYRDIFVFTTIA